MRKLLFYFILFLTFTGCGGQDSIEAILENAASGGTLNGNVLVLQNGETIFEGSYGYADGAKTSKLNIEHRFILGSIFKEFPAVAIMQLQEQNLIKLDDRISKYLPHLPGWAETISVKHLLQYSSGLPMIRWGDYFSQDLEISDNNVWRDLNNIEHLEFEAGTGYLYTNYSPLLLIEIIEHVTKSTFKDYLAKNIFSKCDMPNMVVHDKYPFIDRSLMAIPFNNEFEEDSYALSIPNILLAANVHDLAKWMECLGDFNIINKASVKYLAQKAEIGENEQAPLGDCEWENDDMVAHYHHGSMANYECLVKRFKQEDLTIVILTNQKNGNVHELADRIYQHVKNK